MPSAPSASKNASCGLTATAYGATASTMPRQKRAAASAGASPRNSTGNRSTRGSRPTQSWLRLRSTAAARRSENAAVANSVCTSEVLRHRLDEAYAPRPTATTPSKPRSSPCAVGRGAHAAGPACARAARPPRPAPHRVPDVANRRDELRRGGRAHARDPAWHLDRGWATVGYHFVVSPSGRIFSAAPSTGSERTCSATTSARSGSP